MSTTLLIASSIVSLSLLGCTTPQSSGLVSTREDIVNGTVSGSDDDAVVWVSTTLDVSIQRCSGTLVAPNLVLTALHCVSNYPDSLAFTCDSNGNLVAGPGGQLGTQASPSKIIIQGGTFLDAGAIVAIAKGKQIFAGPTTTICLNDIAFVLLDRELSLPIRPIRLYTGTEPGEVMRVVGYGLDENYSVWTRHYRDGAVVDKVGSSQYRPVGDDVPPNSFTSIGNELCIGDSGGPAISDRGAVAGVFSKVVGSCTAPSAVDTFTQVAPFATNLVLPAFQAAGYEPWLEGNSEPGLYGTGGASGTGGATSIGGSPSTSASGGATSAPEASGGAPLGTGGDTAVVVYDQGPPPGGTCACRAARVRDRSWGAALLMAMATVSLLRRRRG